MNSAIGAVKKVGYYFRIFDPGKNGLRSTDDLSLKLKYEFVLGDPNNSFLYISIWDDDKEKSVEMCLHEVDPLRNANGKNKVITIADTRYIQRWFERKVDPILCKGDLYFFSNCPATAKHQRPRTHERTPAIPPNLDDLEVNDFADVLGTIAEDLHLTRCAQVCFAGTEEDQAEQGDHGTIDEVLGDQDLEQGKDSLEEADRDADLPEQIPLLGHPESEKEGPVSWLRLLRRARVAIERLHRNLRHLAKKHSCRCYVLPELHKTASMLPRLFDVRDATTQCRDLNHTKCHHLDLTRSTTQWESMCSRSLTQLACASQS